MASDRVLSQTEIGVKEDPLLKAQVYDFRRPDRIAKDQLRAIQLLHENFARSLASSLSAYLRAYVTVNLVSVEQLAFAEFAQVLPSPTCMIALGMKPYDGNAVLELNPSLVFPILEMLLGGTGQGAHKIAREITEIEQSILDGLLRIILNDLQSAWQAVTKLEFSIVSHETEPQLLQILAPNEAVVAVSLEVRIGDVAGIMNLGIPSITVKMLRQRFDQQWSVRKAEASEEQHAHVLRLVQSAQLNLDTCLRGPTMPVSTLLEIREGDVVVFDYPIDRALDLMVNNRIKYHGEIVTSGRKRAFQTLELAAKP